MMQLYPMAVLVTRRRQSTSLLIKQVAQPLVGPWEDVRIFSNYRMNLFVSWPPCFDHSFERTLWWYIVCLVSNSYTWTDHPLMVGESTNSPFHVSSTSIFKLHEPSQILLLVYRYSRFLSLSLFVSRSSPFSHIYIKFQKQNDDIEERCTWKTSENRNGNG